MADYTHPQALAAAAQAKELTPILEGQAVYEGAKNLAGGPAKVNYTHEDMIDTILANPRISHAELSARYGYSRGWVSRIISSNSFRVMYAKRRNEVVDPIILEETEQRFKALLDRSLDLLQEKIEDAPLDSILKITEVTAKALKYGATVTNGVVVNNSYVVALPPKAESTRAWESKYGREGKAIDISPSVASEPAV